MVTKEYQTNNTNYIPKGESSMYKINLNNLIIKTI